MRISGRCFAVTGLAYVPPWSVNSGFVAGDGTTLVIDTGATALSAAAIHGYASAVKPGNRIAVFNTEKHFDHIGGNGFFRERAAEIHGHPFIVRTDEEFAQELGDFNAAIPNRWRRELREENAFYAGTTLANPDRPVRGGDTLELGRCVVEVVSTPGHTPTNLSAWVPEDQVLFCGDCLVNRYVANLDSGGMKDWMEWLNSLERIEKLKPKAIVPGHGPVALEDEVSRLIETVRGEIQRALATGVTRTFA